MIDFYCDVTFKRVETAVSKDRGLLRAQSSDECGGREFGPRNRALYLYCAANEPQYFNDLNFNYMRNIVIMFKLFISADLETP